MSNSTAYQLPYDVDITPGSKTGILDTHRSREYIGAGLKNIYERYWLVESQHEHLDTIAEQVLGQRKFGYASHHVEKLCKIYTLWMAHMDAFYKARRIAEPEDYSYERAAS